MSAAMGPYPERIPQSFPEVPPPGDLPGYRGSIGYALGDINATLRHMSEKMERHDASVKDVKETTEAGLREIKASLKIIEEKVLIAETQVKSAFLTSKLFLVLAAGLAGWLAAHWAWIQGHILGG